jgi:hypothetical protein
MDERLVAMTDPFGRRRFYPPGQHPAIRRWVAERKHIASLPESPERDKALAYIEDNIALFEQGESETKALYVSHLNASGPEVEQ